MLDFIGRLKAEKVDLEEKYTKLGEFFGTAQFEQVALHHQRLLYMQHDYMGSYLNILNIRISILEGEFNP